MVNQDRYDTCGRFVPECSLFVDDSDDDNHRSICEKCDKEKAMSNMSQDEIVAEAISRGYRVVEQSASVNPKAFKRDGYRVVGSPVTIGADAWMNAANVRLWQIQVAP